MKFIILAVLLISSFAFKIRQDANGYNTAISDVNAGVAASTAAFNDAVTAGIDATNAAVAQFNQILGQMMGGMTAGATRLQQGGYNDAIADGTTAGNEALDSAQDLLAAGTDVMNAILGQTTAMLGGMTAPASRLQQGGNPLGQAIADFTAAWNTGIQSAEDGLTAGSEAITDAVNQADTALDATEVTGAAAARLQQTNQYADAMNALMDAWNDGVEATEATMTAGADAVQDTTEVTDNLMNGLTGTAPTRLQQGNGVQTVMGDLAALGGDLAAATTDFINGAAAAGDGLAAQADQVVNTLGAAAGGAAARRR